MKLFSCVLACFAVSVNAAELTIVHPGWSETMHGTFLQMNISQTAGGGVEFEVTDHSAVKSPRRIATGPKPIWHIALWIEGQYQYTQSACFGDFAYNYGDPVLTLTCND